MTVTRWIFDYGGTYYYLFPRNPDRNGGDTYWVADSRSTEVDIIGSSLPYVQTDGFKGARRVVRFTAITGDMMRYLQDFYFRNTIISNCRDHLYPTTPQFSCYILSFSTTLHPTVGAFPGSGEDTWDLEMQLVRMS